MTDIEKMKIVREWFDENQNFFKLDQYYGPYLEDELYNLIKKCSDDGDETVST